MNNVVLMGCLTSDPDIRYSQGDNPTCVARYTLAVDRRFKRDGEQSADFIRCIAFGKTAEVTEKWVGKGKRIVVQGRIQTGSYKNKDGATVYTTDVVVENMEFADSKGESTGNGNKQEPPVGGVPDDDGFLSVPEGIEEELPFN